MGQNAFKLEFVTANSITLKWCLNLLELGFSRVQNT